MGMYKSIHVVVGSVVPNEGFKDEYGVTPYMVDEEYDDIAAYSGGELQHDQVVVGKPVFQFSEQAVQFDSDNDVLVDLEEALKENRQEVSEILAEKLEIFEPTSIYLVGQVL